MRKILASLTLMLAVAQVGCITLPIAPWQTPEPGPNSSPVARNMPAPPPPVVLPEQVTPQTRQEVLDALRAELEYENRQ